MDKDIRPLPVNLQSTNTIVKYAAMYHSLISQDTDILKVFDKKNDAIEYITAQIKDEKFDDTWIKIEYEEDYSWCVYELKYVFKKQLIGKYIIREYQDILCDCQL